MSELGLLLRSLPYLRPGQAPQRAWRLGAETALLSLRGIELFKHGHGLTPDITLPADSPRLLLWLLRPDDAGRVASAAGEGTFTYLGIERAYGRPIRWRDPSVPRLWTFRLHSFDWALAMAADDPARWGPFLAQVIEAWVDDNPPRRGDPWHPFVVAERLINVLRTRAAWGPHLPSSSRVIHSLYAQARYLDMTLERDIGGNHLIREATALIVSGAAFGAPTLETRGVASLQRGLARQILEDGGHEELSPSYQLEVLTDVAEARSVLGERHPARRILNSALSRMADFAVSMCHPDGQPAAFNDSSAWPVEPAAYLQALGLNPHPTQVLRQSGYFALGSGGERLFFDAGSPSPRDLPPHAHCDLLSVEASVAGRRMIVNSGTGDYARGPWRDYWRSTRAHNTLELDGTEQSEVWDSFRMARRAAPRDVALMEGAHGNGVTAAHDGYRKLSRPVIHRRTIVEAGAAWIILDSLEGSGVHSVRSFLHLHPDVMVHAEKSFLRLDREDSKLVAIPLGPLRANVHAASVDPIENWYASTLGEHIESQALVAQGQVQLPALLGWVLLPKATEGAASLHGGAEGPHVTISIDGSAMSISLDAFSAVPQAGLG